MAKYHRLWLHLNPFVTLGTHGHKQTYELTMNNQSQRLWVCIRPLPKWVHIVKWGNINSKLKTSIGGNSCVFYHGHMGHMGTYLNMSSQWTTSVGGNRYLSNHRIQGGTWAYTETWIHNEQPVSEVTKVSIKPLYSWGYMTTQRHKSSQWTTSLRVCRYVSNN